jgi:DUF438 domain-containing protein
MPDAAFLTTLLDSLKDQFVFVDTTHTIRCMNKAALAHYDEGAALIGRSVLDCHNAKSQQVIREVFAALQAGEDERFLGDDKKHRIYMRAVRDPAGKLLGYYERYEPSTKATTAAVCP